MSGAPDKTITYLNTLEPGILYTSFLNNPPEGFSVHKAENDLPWFDIDFDLLTTMDDPDRKKVINWPGYRWWQRFLKIKTLFIGTTVSEYALFPSQIPPEKLVQWIKENLASRRKLMVIKDIPYNSPLISATCDNYSRSLMQLCESQGFIRLEGQALAYVPIDFDNLDTYLARLSHSRRRNLRRKLRSRDGLRIEVLNTGDSKFHDETWRAELYQYYLSVYEQSEIHFDKLTRPFFDALLLDETSEGRVFCYWQGDILVGYNLCYVEGNKLVDKYIGLQYPLARQCNLYFVSWFVNLEYAMENGLRYYVAGWTDPEVKKELGASFTLTYHLIWVRNPLLRKVAYRLRHYFESDSKWHQPQ